MPPSDRDRRDRERREAVSEALLGRVDHHIIVAMEMESSPHLEEQAMLEESLQITKGLLESARADLQVYENDDAGAFSRGYEEGKREVRKKCMDYLLHVGEELAENGEELSEIARLEGAIRRRAGWLFHDVAQMMFTDQRSDDFDKRIGALQGEIEKAIGMSMEEALAEIKELEKKELEEADG